MNSARAGSGLTSLYVLMYHTFASPLSQVPARRVWSTSGIPASSIYSSTLNAQAVMWPSERSVPSNLSGLEILILSDICGRFVFGDAENVRVYVCVDVDEDVGEDVDVNVDVNVGVCVCVVVLTASISLVVIPRARSSLERGT